MFPFFLDGVELKDQPTHKHVGFWLQSDMKWTTHMDNIIAQAGAKLVLLKSHRFRFNKRALRQMYLAFVRPVLEYGSAVWCNISQFDQDRLESINLSALRAIAGAKIGTSHDLLYRETGIDPLHTTNDSPRCILRDQTIQDKLKLFCPNNEG